MDNCLRCKKHLRGRRLDGDQFCPPCDLIETKLDAARFKQEQAARKKRHCRTCNKTLPANLYFRCESCSLSEPKAHYLISHKDLSSISNGFAKIVNN